MTKMIDDLPEDRQEAILRAIQGNFSQMEVESDPLMAGTVASLYATAAAAWLAERFGPRLAYDLFQGLADTLIECQLPEGK